jgi:hypothetical protein
MDFEEAIGNAAEVGMNVAGAAAGAPIRLRGIRQRAIDPKVSVRSP